MLGPSPFRLLLFLCIGITLPSCASLLDFDDIEIQSEDAGSQDATVVDAAPNDDASDGSPFDGGIDVFEGGSDQAQDPCQGVDCGPFGQCTFIGGQVVCDCQDGHHAEGLSCVEDPPPDPCESITCGANASCQGGNCVCDAGYEGDPAKGCKQPTPLEDQVRAELVAIATAELGSCEGVDDKSYMQYQPGLWCYDFVAWVYSQSSHPLPSPISLPTYQASNLPTGWQPKPGDLIKFTIQHYGMVASVSSSGSITTLEGNYNSCVHTRSITNSSVEYYGTLEGLF